MSDDKSDLLRSLSIDDSAREKETRGVPVAAVLVLVLLAVGGVAGAWFLAFEQGRQSGLAEAPVLVQPPSSGTTPGEAPAPEPVVPRTRGLIASGYVVARRRATVSAELTGRLLEVYVEEGAQVEKDQILARLDSRLAELDLDLARARAEVQQASADAIAADLREAQAALSRSTELADRQFSSRADLDLARARAVGLEARLKAARAEARVALVSADRQAELVDRFSIRAPFSGVIIDKNAQVGEIISPTSAGGGFTRTGVYTLVDMGSLEIEVDVNEGQIQNITAEQRATAVLDAYPGVAFPARVIAIIPTANRDRATIQVRVGFDDLDPRILPEMAAKVTFEARTE